MEIGNLISTSLIGLFALGGLIGLLSLGRGSGSGSRPQRYQGKYETPTIYKGRRISGCSSNGDCDGLSNREYAELQAQAAMTQDNSVAFGVLYQAHKEAREMAGRSGRGSREPLALPGGREPLALPEEQPTEVYIPLTDKDLAFYLFADKD
jgi:hypothetical protein